MNVLQIKADVSISVLTVLEVMNVVVMRGIPYLQRTPNLASVSFIPSFIKEILCIHNNSIWLFDFA